MARHEHRHGQRQTLATAAQAQLTGTSTIVSQSAQGPIAAPLLIRKLATEQINYLLASKSLRHLHRSQNQPVALAILVSAPTYFSDCPTGIWIYAEGHTCTAETASRCGF
jgi:hypothetical protein